MHRSAPGRLGPRRLWPALLLLGLAAVLLGLALLMLIGAAGLIAGLQSGVAESPTAPAPPRPPLVLVLPAAQPHPLPAPEQITMPKPEELANVAAAPLPTPMPPAETPALQPAGGIGGELTSPSQRQEERAATYADLFRRVGEQSGIDWRLLAALAYRESRMDPLALGRDGDMGLMQILPTTWDEFAPQVAAGDPFDPRQNVQVAAAYLVYLQDFLLQLKTNDLRWVLVAYNWGPENVRRHFARGGLWEEVPAPQQRYVADILDTAFGPTGSE